MWLSDGAACTVISVSHLAERTPAKPGTTARSGNPCAGASGLPFMSQQISVSGDRALASGMETP